MAAATEFGGAAEDFDRLLASLDRDRERAGEVYESLRRRLLTYFRMHGFPDAHDLFDQTMERAARRLSDTAVANTPAYITGIARLVCLEAERKQRRQVALADVAEPTAPGSGANLSRT
jgi:DNA-directed RNA polymerase specialized sigma24 family protein